MQIALLVIGCVLSFAASVSCGLVLWNFKLLSDRLDKMDTRVGVLEELQRAGSEQLSKRPGECRKDFVDKVDYIRAVTSLEQKLDNLIQSNAEIKGKLGVVEQMPKICGSVAGEIVKEMRQEVRHESGR